MDPLHRKRRQTNRDVFRAVRAGSAIPHPLPFMGDNRLARSHVYETVAMLDSQTSAEDYRELFEFRCLSGLDPAAGAPHMRHAGRAGP